MPFFKSTNVARTATITEPTQYYIALCFVGYLFPSNEIKFGLLKTEANQGRQPHKSFIQLVRAMKVLRSRNFPR